MTKICLEPGWFGRRMPCIDLSGLSFNLTNVPCERHIKASSDCGADSWRSSAPPTRWAIKDKVAHLHQEPFQAASLEECRISELSHLGVIATPGRQKRRAEPLLTESVVNLYVLIPLPLLYYCPSFYHLKGRRRRSWTFHFLSKIKHFLTYLSSYNIGGVAVVVIVVVIVVRA